MKVRSISITVTIKQGIEQKDYRLKPLAAAELPTPFVQGFRLTGISDNPSPIYQVMVARCGAINCTCPAWQRSSQTCKHAEALQAAGLLPVQFVRVLAERTKLLDQAEEEFKRLCQQAIEEQVVYQHDTAEMSEKIGQLEYELRSVSERCQQLQFGLAAVAPKRVRRRKAA